jgi:thioredoxin-like negative regulator of GroEL
VTFLVKEINEKELEELIKSTKVVIVDFSATWCGPCKSLGKILESKVAPKLEGKKDIALVKIDIDQNRNLSSALQIQGVPTMMFFFGGKRIVFQTEKGQEDRIVGFLPNIDQVIMNLVDQLEKSDPNQGGGCDCCGGHGHDHDHDHECGPDHDT